MNGYALQEKYMNEKLKPDTVCFHIWDCIGHSDINKEMVSISKMLKLNREV